MGYETKYDKDKISTIFTLCGCGNEILLIQYDHDYQIADICIFGSYNHHKMNFWQKIKYIFQMLWVGYPYKDQTMLDKNQLHEIKKFLDTILN